MSERGEEAGINRGRLAEAGTAEAAGVEKRCTGGHERWLQGLGEEWGGERLRHGNLEPKIKVSQPFNDTIMTQYYRLISFFL